MDEASTVTVTGQGRVSGKPDTASVQLGVEVRAATAAAALDRANDRATTLLAAIRGLGIDGDDIRTGDVSLYPLFENNGQQVTSYVASNQVTATIRSIERVGQTLDSVAREVGDEVRFHGITFSIDDATELIRAARAAAVADALDRANQLAEAAGAALGEVVSIVEHPDGRGIAVMRQAFDGARKGAPIEAGSQEVMVNAMVTYRLIVG